MFANNKFTDMKRLFFCLLMAFVAVIPLKMQAQIIDPVQWTFAIENLNENEFDLVATATIDPQYHIYSTKMPDLAPLTSCVRTATSRSRTSSHTWERITRVAR